MRLNYSDASKIGNDPALCVEKKSKRMATYWHFSHCNSKSHKSCYNTTLCSGFTCNILYILRLAIGVYKPETTARKLHKCEDWKNSKKNNFENFLKKLIDGSRTVLQLSSNAVNKTTTKHSNLLSYCSRSSDCQKAKVFPTNCGLFL